MLTSTSYIRSFISCQNNDSQKALCNPKVLNEIPARMFMSMKQTKGEGEVGFQEGLDTPPPRFDIKKTNFKKGGKRDGDTVQAKEGKMKTLILNDSF